MSEVTSMRRELVRLAGRWPQMNWFSRNRAIEAICGYAAFSRQLRIYHWGPPKPGPRVSVPRSLRRYFGWEVEL